MSKGLIHSRKISVSSKNINIKDNVSGIIRDAKARFILDRRIELRQIKENEFKIITSNKSQLVFKVCHGYAQIVPWQHTNKFGVLWETRCNTTINEKKY